MYKLNEKITYREVDDTLLIITPWNNLIHSTESVGKDVFLMIVQHLSFNEISLKITQDYDITEEEANHDIKEFIDSLIVKEILIAG